MRPSPPATGSLSQATVAIEWVYLAAVGDGSSNGANGTRMCDGVERSELWD